MVIRINELYLNICQYVYLNQVPRILKKSGFIIVFLLLLCSPHLHAETQDSLIYFNDLNFRNEFEKAVFVNYLNKQSINQMDLFMTPYKWGDSIDVTAAHLRVDECVSNLHVQIDGKTNVKKAKIVYEYVHKTFLKVFKLQNSFSDIFTKGEYNCVGATALYSVIFSRLNIPYQIKEKPHHVYLIAYPNEEKILIETTSPNDGYFAFNNDFQVKYVNNLTKQKLIAQNEIDHTSTEELFNKYYFSSENISLVQLAAFQYVNYGIYHITDKEFDGAIIELKKADLLYPCERIAFALKISVAFQIDNNNYDSLKQVANLLLLCRFNNQNDDEISDELIKNEFARLTQCQLINHSNFSRYDSSWAAVRSVIKDTLLKNDIDFTYHLETVRISYINSSDKEKELWHLKAAYDINPMNANLQALIISHLGNRFDKNDDANAAMTVLDKYGKNFSFLETNTLFNKVKGTILLEMSYRSFVTNDLQKGNSYMKSFEDLYELKKPLTIENKFVEKTYSTAAAVYFKKGNYARSKQIIQKGLYFAPESFRMQQMLREF